MIDYKQKDKIKQLYINIENSRRLLSDLVYEEIIQNTLDVDDTLDCDNWEVEQHGYVIKITIPECPSRLTETKKIYRERWIRNTCAALKKLQHKPVYEKIYVLVKVYYSNKDWDIDNRDLKPLIDGIRYSRLIKGDNIKNVAYIADGDISENERTEVTILPYSPVENALKNVLDTLCPNMKKLDS
jgi:hypothetical protein